MTAPRLIAAMLATALIGGLTGALITLAVTDRGEDERGTVVRVGTTLNFDAGPWCDPHHRFCIPEFEDPEDARAFYMVHTHQVARERACPVEWQPDHQTALYVDSPDAPLGAFRGLCIGNVWLEDGTNVFGPASRNLDEFPVTIERQDDPAGDVEWFLVDTRTLI